MDVLKLIQAIDIFPNYKTYCGFLFMVGMLMCEAFQYHKFSDVEWRSVAIATGLAWKIGLDRDKGILNAKKKKK